MATSAVSKPSLKVADEVWTAVAMLHQRHPERTDFSIEEIMEFAKTEKQLRLLGPLRPGFYVHVVQHCVANRPANPGRYRMLFETAPGRRRLFRSRDNYDTAREAAKTMPERDEIPAQYAPLLDWYRNWREDSIEERIKNDPLLALYGDGKDLWADEHADDYVRRIREGWE